jgi:hypothetical protein
MNSFLPLWIRAASTKSLDSGVISLEILNGDTLQARIICAIKYIRHGGTGAAEDLQLERENAQT